MTSSGLFIVLWSRELFRYGARIKSKAKRPRLCCKVFALNRLLCEEDLFAPVRRQFGTGWR